MESIPAHAFVVFLAKFGHVPRLPALSRLGRTLVPGVQAHLTRYRGSARAGEGKREGCMAEHLVIFPGTGLRCVACSPTFFINSIIYHPVYIWGSVQPWHCNTAGCTCTHWHSCVLLLQVPGFSGVSCRAWRLLTTWPPFPSSGRTFWWVKQQAFEFGAISGAFAHPL